MPDHEGKTDTQVYSQPKTRNAQGQIPHSPDRKLNNDSEELQPLLQPKCGVPSVLASCMNNPSQQVTEHKQRKPHKILPPYLKIGTTSQPTTEVTQRTWMSNITNAHKTSRPKIQGQAPLPLCYRGRMFPHFSLLPKQNRHLKTKIPKETIPNPWKSPKETHTKNSIPPLVHRQISIPPLQMLTYHHCTHHHHITSPKRPQNASTNYIKSSPNTWENPLKNARNSIPPLRLLYMHNLFSKISLTYARIGWLQPPSTSQSQTTERAPNHTSQACNTWKVTTTITIIIRVGSKAGRRTEMQQPPTCIERRECEWHLSLCLSHATKYVALGWVALQRLCTYKLT